MSSNQPLGSRCPSAAGALAAVVAAFAALAAPAFATTVVASPTPTATAGQGSAAVLLASHRKGRTLSGQGVKVLAAAPATKSGRTLTLPISLVDPHANASASAEGGLNFQRGKHTVQLTGLRFNLAAGTVSGRLGDQQIDVFKVAGPASANATSGAVSLSEGKLRLTTEVAAALKEELELKRALRRDGVGTAWVAAKANPIQVPKPIVSGKAEWGVLASWRAYVLGEFGPFSVGTIAVGDGATASGPLTSPATIFGFPSPAGSFKQGLYGAPNELSMVTQGNVVFAKPGHCIIEVKLANLELTLNGADSSIVLDSDYDVDTPQGKTCEPQPPVSNSDVRFASLDLSGVVPTYSADGKTITWSSVPASLTAEGSVAFLGSKYPVGQPLDPVTITVGIG